MTPVSFAENCKNAPGTVGVRYKQLITDSAFKDLSSHLPSPPPSPTLGYHASKLKFKATHKPVRTNYISSIRQSTRMDICDACRRVACKPMCTFDEEPSLIQQVTTTRVCNTLPSPCGTPTPRSHLQSECNLPEIKKPKKNAPAPEHNEDECKRTKNDNECTFPGAYPIDELDLSWFSKWTNRILTSPPPSLLRWTVLQIFGW